METTDAKTRDRILADARASVTLVERVLAQLIEAETDG